MTNLPPPPALIGPRLTRRTMIGVLGVASLTPWLGCGGDSDSQGPVGTPSPTPAPTPTPAQLSCIVTPAQTEGPYFVDERLLRSDLTTDTDNASVLDGLPLRLELGVYRVDGRVDGASCAPLSGAQVDVWHADPEGTYSGVGDASGQDYLRGYQVTGADGAVAFTTIYPGWYPGRAVHIHFKVRFFAAAGDTTYDFTSQLYFDEALTAQVVTAPAYSARGEPDTPNEGDLIFADGGTELIAVTEPAADGAGWVARYTIGLEMT